MTEYEAKLKWCHLTMSKDAYDRCEGSKCMAWRWEKEIVNIQPQNFSQGQLLTQEQHGKLFTKTQNSEHGYCGLAGKP